MRNHHLLLAFFLAFSVFASAAEWSAQGGAVLAQGVNLAGNPCVTAVGAANGKGYGGLVLTTPLDLRGAKPGDCIRFRLLQNLGGMVVMLRGPGRQIYRSIRLPEDGKEISLSFDPAQWQTGKKGQPAEFGEFTNIAFYASHFKHPSQRLSFTDLVIEKDGKELFAYHAVGTAPQRRNQVVNFGRGGHNTADLLRAQLPPALKRNPTLAIVMIGTNDFGNPRKLVPADQYERNLRQIVAALQKAGAKVILVTPPPCIPAVVKARPNRAPDAPPIADLAAVAATVRRVAKETGCVLVDYHAIVSAHGDLEGVSSWLRNPANSGSMDGVHPTREGYAALAKALADTIRQNGLDPARTVCLGDSITYGSAMIGAGTATGECYPGQLSALLQ